MRLNKATYIFATILLSLVVTTASVHAASIPIAYSLSGTGTVVGMTATTLTLQADCTGSFVSGNPTLDANWNPISYTDTSVLDLTTNLLNGNFTIEFADGDTLAGLVDEDQTVPDNSPTGTGPFPQTLTFTGGTGEFAGASGSASGQGFLGSTDFTVNGAGTINLTATPEPAAYHLLVAGCLALLFGRASGRLAHRPLKRW